MRCRSDGSLAGIAPALSVKTCLDYKAQFCALLKRSFDALGIYQLAVANQRER